MCSFDKDRCLTDPRAMPWSLDRELSMSPYDCAVIGAGHNGLVAAAYLARAGR